MALLSSNTVYALHGPSNSAVDRPRITKQAMLVKLSPEMLAALQKFPQKVEIDLSSDAPGFYLDGTSFAIQQSQEEKCHDLYVWAPTAAKPNVPLRLNATISRNILVEQDLENVRKRIRQTAKDAAEQHSQRRTQLIDVPPDNPEPKRKKDPKRKPAPPRSQDRLQVSVFSAVRPKSPAPPPISQEVSDQLRYKIVHDVALRHPTPEDVVKHVGGENCTTSQRQTILQIFEEVAERTQEAGDKPNKPSGRWQLKVEAVPELRPYEWPGLAATERINLARKGRAALSSLKRPESDPIWGHFRYLPEPTPPASASPRSIQPLPSVQKQKRGVSSTDAKKKTRPKIDPLADIQIKDERKSRPATAKPPPARAPPPSLPKVEGLHTSASPSAIAATRKLPGSGFHLAKPAQVATTSTVSKTLPQKPHQRHSLPAGPGGPSRPKTYPLDAEPDSDVQKSSGANRTEAGGQVLGTSKRRKVREMEDNDTDSPAPSAAKRRKTEVFTTVSSSHKTERDLSLPRKPPNDVTSSSTRARQEASQLPRIKKELSPLPRVSQDIKSRLRSPPPAPTAPAGTPSSKKIQVSSSRSHSSMKKGRRQVSYTSSEDEADSGNQSTLPTPPTKLQSSYSHSHSQSQRLAPPKTTSQGHAELRAKYEDLYADYLVSYHKIHTQKVGIQRLLQKGSSETVTDSDGDFELMDADALTKLTNRHQEQEGELRRILKLFANG